MRNLAWLLIWIAFIAGCASPAKKLENRKQEKYSAYTALSPEMRELVDRGQIAIGMPMDAVYIVWGKPSQAFTGQSDKGTITTWIYTGTGWQEQRFWNYRYHGYGRRGRYIYPEAYLDYDYVPYTYTAAEVVFENGHVKSWRQLTAPP